MRRILALVLVLAAAPTAVATGEIVDIVDVDAPPRTLAGLAFHADVTLHNKAASPESVHLLAALYAPGSTGCGPATDPAFGGFTHLVQERFDLSAGETRVVSSWANRYDRARVEAAPRDATWCVFVARSEGPRIEYLDVHEMPLSVRGENAKPVATFSWTPERPLAGQEALYRAEASDADGDPVTFRWDFGHATARGRATAEGEAAAHAIYPEGTFTVTLEASDGLETTIVTREVTVLPQAPTTSRVDEGDGGRDAIPFPALVTLAAGAWAARAAARSRRPPRRPRSR